MLDFHFILIAISALTKNCQFSVNLFIDYCNIQEHTKGIVIRMLEDKEISMFFYSLSSSSKFTDVSTKYNKISLSQNDLYHFRLGLSSYVKLYILRKVN